MSQAQLAEGVSAGEGARINLHIETHRALHVISDNYKLNKWLKKLATDIKALQITPITQIDKRYTHSTKSSFNFYT